MMTNLRKIIALIITTLMLISCNGVMEHGSIDHIRSVTNHVDDNRLVSADETPGDWLSYGRNYNEDRFSELDQITKNNIDRI